MSPGSLGRTRVMEKLFLVEDHSFKRSCGTEVVTQLLNIYYTKYHIYQEWWCIPVNPAPRRQKQENSMFKVILVHKEFEASLEYITWYSVPGVGKGRGEKGSGWEARRSQSNRNYSRWSSHRPNKGTVISVTGWSSTEGRQTAAACLPTKPPQPLISNTHQLSDGSFLQYLQTSV